MASIPAVRFTDTTFLFTPDPADKSSYFHSPAARTTSRLQLSLLSLLDSSVYYAAPDFESAPRGRMIIAQRFIAGINHYSIDQVRIADD
jgi:hypothetical protein